MDFARFRFIFIAVSCGITLWNLCCDVIQVEHFIVEAFARVLNCQNAWHTHTAHQNNVNSIHWTGKFIHLGFLNYGRDNLLLNKWFDIN